MPQLCAATKCNRASRGVCDCCQQNLCLQHLNEHNGSLISQLDPLTDEINTLGNRLKLVDFQQTVGSCRQKLQEWRDDCYHKIDYLFQRKSKELDRLVDQKVKNQQQEIARIQSKVAELIRQKEATREDIDSLTSTINHLKEQMNRIEDTCFDIKTVPLMIDDSYIHVRGINELDLKTLPPICKIITRPVGSKAVINSNGRYILMHQKPNLCLVDQELSIVKEVPWTHDSIYDMCWSSTIKRFILVAKKRIFLVDDETMTFDHVKAIEERQWLSCTCSEDSLFLVTNEKASSIIKFTLLPTIELVKQWKPPQTCARDETIDNIIYNNGVFSVAIKDRSDKSLRLELRSADTLVRIWSLRFDTVCKQKIPFRSCLLTCNEWLVIDYESKCLLHVTNDGKLKTTISYDTIPYCANLFADMLIISSDSGLKFHELRL